MMLKRKRPAAFLLAAAMIFTMPGFTAYAVEADVPAAYTGVCEHHPEHTKDCGYTEGTEGTPCGHEHTEECYIQVKKCVHEHDESCYPISDKSEDEGEPEGTETTSEAEKPEPTECTHVCSEENGCITKEADCVHGRGEHNDTCGYVPGEKGTPCTYECEICGPKGGDAVQNDPEACICEIRCKADDVDSDCPVCRDLKEDFDLCKGKEAEPDTAFKIVRWNFEENPDGAALTEQDGKTVVELSTVEGGISLDELTEILPREISADVRPEDEAALEETDDGSIEYVTIEISGWSCPEYKAETIPGTEREEEQTTWPADGEYLFTPRIEGDYEFEEAPVLTVSIAPAQISLLANAGAKIDIMSNIVYANGIPIVIKENNGITSIYDENGTLLSGDTDVSQKWIFGGWSDGGRHSGSTSVRMESGTVTQNIYGGSNKGTLEGNTNVVIEGGKVGWVYGGGQYDSVNGTARVTVYPGSKIWGGSAGDDTVDEFNRGTVFGGGLGGTVKNTKVILEGGDFGWAYGGGYDCTVENSTDIRLLGNPDRWCSVYGGGNGGSIKEANLTARGVANSGYAIYMYGGGWSDSVGTANITIGGDCRFAGNVGVYAAGSGESEYNTSTVENANFVIDDFDKLTQYNTTVCGPLVGTNVAGEVNVLVTGTQTRDTSMQLLLKDIDDVKLEQCSVVLFGGNPLESGKQPLELERLEVTANGEAIFPYGNTIVNIRELAGSGKLLFQGYEGSQPTMITGVEKVSSTAASPLQISVRGNTMTVENNVFVSGPGITSAVGFRSGHYGYVAVKTDAGIELQKSSGVVKYTKITQASFDRASYAYGEKMKLSLAAETTDGTPLAGETLYIGAGDGTVVASAVLDSQGKAVLELPVDTYLRNLCKGAGRQNLRVVYNGNEQYWSDVRMMNLEGTNEQAFTLTDADIVLNQEIPAPALNANPIRTLDTGDTFYTAEVVWSPDTTLFEADTIYSASIVLKAKQGYDFNSLGTITYQGTQVTPQVQSDGSQLLPGVKTFSTVLSGDQMFRTEQNVLDTVPEELKNLFSSIDQLKEALYKGAAQQMAEITESNMAYYDVKLFVSLDGGQSWEPATEGNFPEEGILVTLNYPAGTNGATHDFAVAHMLTRSMNGKVPGAMEYPAVQETAAGITFRVYSLSPIAVGWKRTAPDVVNNDTSSDGSSDDSSSGSTGTMGNAGQTAPAATETSPVKPDANGNALVDNGSVRSAIDKVRAQAGRNGVAVTVPITPEAGQSMLAVTIPAQTLDLLVQENVKQFKADIAGVFSGEMDGELLRWLDAVSGGGDIILRIKPAGDVNSDETRAAIGSRPACDLSLVYVLNGTETPITDLGGHTMAVRLPYTPAQGEQPGCLYAVYVNQEGQTEWLTRSVYEADRKAVLFELKHFSIYGVGYRTPIPTFNDIAGHPGVDDILFAVSRGLLSGRDDTAFSPDTKVTREEFVTALERLKGSSPDNGPFTSVLGVYGPDINITRAQAAVILRGLAKFSIDPLEDGWLQNLSGQWSYYRSGESVKGWISDEQKWYWLDENSGKMFSGGWLQIGGKWYYFYPDGSMAANTVIDGYAVGADGDWIE